MRTFRKQVPAGQPDPFSSEAFGLETLAATGAARVPEVVAFGTADGYHFLELEHLDLAGSSSPRFADALRSLHAHTSPDGRYGFPQDNFIGANPQENCWESSWATFFVEHRLRAMFRNARQAGFHFSEEDALAARAHALLAGHQPAASLLHGDLWAGNATPLRDGTPVFYDPAPYYGDPETDLAFTTLFGGFPESFYEAYPPRHPHLHPLYNLYHLLNHVALFGAGYLGQTRACIGSILRA